MLSEHVDLNIAVGGKKKDMDVGIPGCPLQHLGKELAIQRFVPNRYCDVADCAYNSTAPRLSRHL